MKEITQTMWNLARQSNFEYSFIDIKQPIRDSLLLISEQFRQHQIEIATEIEDNLPSVYGDANQLHQVFLNFLTNAKDAIDENGMGMAKIRVFPIADMRYVQIQIIDNGRGIPADIIDSIFNPFFTTKAPGKGTGLGLSINFSIIEQHNGFINVYSEGSKGTLFSMVLPTKEFASCSKDCEENDMELLAPCWVSHPTNSSESHLRSPDCLTCEIYLRFQQSPPAMSLAEDFKKFIAEVGKPIS
jgi:C4-dicarboxylate-specific signal transduction histidine kinase